MATRSHIGIKQPNGTIDYIYSHWDGYPEHHGPILVNHYNNIDKINQLLELGSVSVLAEEIGEQQDFNDRSTHRDNWCLAYGRDRGEKNIEKQNASFKELLEDDYVDYLYIFENNEWTCYDMYGDYAINLNKYKTESIQS